ncbi:nitrogenase cofactor biosynthesis protein NifB [Agaribacterium haliotis]|uniref:nitrogenase cofactor biosynthesis protein NifB n=1 Tax=Agaribacterium haliotis TaxID=2013869 RepID=UPI000BB595ED|nr:nitrogenase cofactor biosynthesis protein NifB [Agaribacterium haliotis]
MELNIIASSCDDGSAPSCGAGDTGAAASVRAALPAHIQKKIETHPCYSDQAHHHFARMHVAVAPACNIQCNYCNRKYDCSNESRPGVVSEVLQPEQALKKVKAVAAEIPQLSVLGIAGPGDALANAKRSFETFKLLSQETPDLKLCLSTNGLMLPPLIDELCAFNIDHVTITINCIDADIGQKIYPWIYWKNRRIRGRKAAKILIEQQLLGLSLLTERGVLVKVNTVLIPGINDHHVAELSKEIKKRGAFLHNLMPLIAEKEHGSYFGLMGQRAPSAEELEQAQQACGVDMKLMRHCRQCRADAVGMLNEDRGAEFSLDKIAEQDIDYKQAQVRRAAVQKDILNKLKPEYCESVHSNTEISSNSSRLIAVASKGQGLVNQHFGHATEFLLYRADADSVQLVGSRRVSAYCHGSENCDEQQDLLEQSIACLEGCEAVLCAKIGWGPWQKLEAAGIRPSSDHAMERIDAAVAAIYKELNQQQQTCAELSQLA